MSIVTLKKKSQAQYNNSSVGKPQFSLNGTRRSAGYVGQDTLGRSLIRTISKNGAQKGHGGNNGQYVTSPTIVSPEMMPLNNLNTVKPSSLNTKGLIMSSYKWIRRPQPYSTTKPDNNTHNNIQSTYIDSLARKTIYNGSLKCNQDDFTQTNCKRSCAQEFMQTNYVRSNENEITKPESALGAVNASDHVRTLTKKCHENDDFKHPNNNKNTPFSC